MRLDIKDGQDILAMISAEGEKIPLNKVVKARNQVEGWLLLVQQEMVATIQKIMKAGLADANLIERKQWVTKHYGQVVATISQVSWCNQTEAFIGEMGDNPFALTDWYQLNVLQLT